MRLLDFETAIRQRGIFAVGPPLRAYLMQPFRCNGQAEQLGAMPIEDFGQFLPLEILGDQGIIGRPDAELQRQVQAGGGFPAAADADQDDVGRLQVAVALAVVMGQAVIDGLDAVLIGLVLADVGETPHPA